MCSQYFRWLVCCLAIIVLAGQFGTSLAADRYVLQVPGRTDLTSSALVDQQQLVINDPQNQTFQYQRLPQLDSPDGRYWGYYSRAAGQTLRWPTTNAGAMLIGDAAGQNWRQSRQQIQAAAAQGLPQRGLVTRRPNYDQAGIPPVSVAENVATQRYRGPMEVAYTPSGPQALEVGYIGPQGDLQLYRGWRDQWKPLQIVNSSRTNPMGLLPGAPLRLVSQAGQQLPFAYTVTSGGELVEISQGQQLRKLSNGLQLSPRSHLALVGQNTQQGFAVDAQGRLWNLDLAAGRHQLIDQTPGQFPAGSPISVVSEPTGRGTQDLFLVDRSGQIVNYASANGLWNGPRSVAQGFPPGAPLTGVSMQLGGRSQIRLGGVDVRGQVQTLGQTAAGWQQIPVRGATLPPGSPLAFTQVGTQLSLAGVGPGGVWVDWDFVSGQWNSAAVNRGFLSGAPIVADPLSQTAFGVDATGRLVAGGYWDDAWHSHLLLPGVALAPQLVSQRVIPNRGLKPATIVLDNPSQEELVVQMFDPLQGQTQFNIPPGGSVPQTVRRDGGGTLEEVYLVPGPFGGFVEQVDSFPLPPQPGPTLVVWAKRVTYSYIDRKKISVVPDFDLKSHVSLGVFDLPPGEYLQDGDRFDAYQEAVARRNPGAARGFGPPVPDADVNVPLLRDNGPPPAPPGRIPQNNNPSLPPLPALPKDSSQNQQGLSLPPLPE